jgi:hypothetical protein
MYNTPKEIHVAVQSGLNQIDSNRKRTFRPEEIDYAFNNAMLKYIEERSVIQPTPNGLFENVKRIDDLRDLEVVDKEGLIHKITGKDKHIYFLPVDYFKFQDLKVGINYICNRKEPVVYTDSQVVLNILPFDDISNQSDFANFEILITGGVSLYKSVDHKLDSLYNVESKFMIVNSVLETIPFHRSIAAIPAYDIYWETYGGMKYDNCFIIITDFNTPQFFELKYGNKDIKSSVFKFPLEVSTETEGFTFKPTEILNTTYKNDILDNHYYNKNRHLKPFIWFENNIINIQPINNAIYNNGYLTYIKRPVMLNYKSNIMTDFKSHISEIIDMTITNLSLTLLGSAEANAAISNNNIK